MSYDPPSYESLVIGRLDDIDARVDRCADQLERIANALEMILGPKMEAKEAPAPEAPF